MPEQRVNILVYRPDSTLVAQYLLGDGEHLIGRDINCPIYLDSEYISSNHAKLHLSHDGILIEDLNSTSGTFLDGVTVRGKLRIKPGQLLQVGDLTVRLQPESEGQIGPGSRLGDGRYTLIRMLGRGGMGEVWLAKDEQLDEEVALKKLPPEVGADAMALADMRREVQKSRALSHPNIIRIHDLIQKSGEDPLISLEYVDGTDLTAIAATKTNGVFGWEDIKGWILQLVSALEYAHEEKIVHRDLKPGNIMISRKGRLKLADFGIAATVADSLSRSSMQGFISGTTLYMSPQQMEGTAPRETDDIYAFGATLYELLTSRAPFYTGNVEHQVLQVTPTPPSQRLAEFGFISEVPPHINELVMACLAKVPESRPQSMTAIRDWIQSEGKAKGAIPKTSTKTIKMRAPVAVVGQPGGDVQQGGSRRWRINALGALIIIMSFVIGILLSRGGKKDEPTPNSDSNGSAAVLPASLTEGLVAYYPFNGNAKDKSGNGNDGEVTGATFVDDRHGTNQRACYFDGDLDYIEIEHSDTVSFQAENFTISLWVKYIAVGDWHALFIKASQASPWNGPSIFAMGDRMGGRITGNHLHYSKAHLGDNTWHQFVFLKKGDDYKFFVDGNLDFEVRQALGNVNITTEPIVIGANHSNRSQQNYKGFLDDIRIYNRALTEAEVKALYEFEKSS